MVDVLKPKYAVIALLGALAVVASACTSSGTSGQGSGSTGAGSSTPPSTSASAPASTSASTTAAPAPPAKKVNVRAYPDGSTVGVGMPIIATFNRKITDAREFAKDTVVSVNDKPVDGAWYFEYTDPGSGHVMEAHYRTQNYWPAHARIHVDFKLANVSAGKGLVFDGRLTSIDFQTGAANIATVDDSTHTMTVMSDGKKYGTFPVSLGADNTPTASGVKVIMEKGRVVRMRGPGYDDCCVKYTQRLTYGGEYLHSAPWNLANIGHRDTSNGCTNLRPADAIKLYNFLEIGDVVIYPNANGPAMRLGDGYGDWNVDWSVWQTGGAVPTH